MEILKEVTAQDLIEFGFESEFVGRLPVIVVFDELTKEDLVEILKNPNNPIIISKRLDFRSYGIDIAFDGVAPEVILFSSLVTAGMPFLLLVGAAPNAIAYESGQFSSGTFFLAGVPASILLMIVLAIFVWLIWPLMGMPVVVH